MAYENFTKFAGTFGTWPDYGYWTESTGSGTPEDPCIGGSFIVEGQLRAFMIEFERESDAIADYEYPDTLKAYGVSSSPQGLAGADIERADLQLVRAILTACIRMDYFSNGSIVTCANLDILDRCLIRLNELDTN